MLYEDVRLEGHIIDSLTLPQVLDDILALGGDYRILDFQIGHTPDDTSTAVLRVQGRDAGAPRRPARADRTPRGPGARHR